MRLGCCTNWFGGEDKQRLALMDERLTVLDEAGYDFAELAVGMLTAEVSEREYSDLVKLVNDHRVTVDAFNVFIPPKYSLVGPDRDLAGVLEHVDLVADRMAGLGGKIVVLGSGGARRRPEGVTEEEAIAQILEFIDGAAPLLKSRGITMALEHLNSGETNTINSVAEAKALLPRIDHDNVKLLVDLYHMLQEGESLDVLEDGEGLVAHVHVADTGRVRPGAGEADFPAFRDQLRKINYTGGISVECRFEDFAAEAAPTYEFLRSIWG